MVSLNLYDAKSANKLIVLIYRRQIVTFLYNGLIANMKTIEQLNGNEKKTDENIVYDSVL